MKNTFAPINRIPPEVLSLIPAHCDTDRELIALTHVCRGLRELFISHASLWTYLDCTNVDKTRVYIERSKASPLEVHLEEYEDIPFLNDAFLLTVPHLGRLGSLTLSGSSDDVLQLTKYFASPAPLLKKLRLRFARAETPVIQDAIFDGDLSSLCELRLYGVITNLAWGNLSNLITFDLRQVPSNEVSVTRLLDFFERAPLLRKIHLLDAFPDSSDAPPERVVSLPHLKYLTIAALPVHTILLNHLLIPTGASLHQGFDFVDYKSPILAYLPKTFGNLKNLSHITSISLAFNSGMSLRLGGPSGTHYVDGNWNGGPITPPTVERRILRSLTQLRISAIERLAITKYHAAQPLGAAKSPAYEIFLLMNNLRALTLTLCHNLSFISALNPRENPSETIVCPELEELVLHIGSKDWFCINEMLKMVAERASSGAKLSTITIVSLQEFVPAKEVLKLRNHVSRVKYRLDDSVSAWHIVPADADCTGYESDW